MEKRIYHVPVFMEDRYVKSGILVEFPFQKYDVPFDQFYNKQSKLNDHEKVLKDWFRCFLDKTPDPCIDILRDQDGKRKGQRYL